MNREAMLENACRESPRVGLLVSKEAGLVMKFLFRASKGMLRRYVLGRTLHSGDLRPPPVTTTQIAN
eukprot:9255782-Pyramimonas_sp.AAC.1